MCIFLEKWRTRVQNVLLLWKIILKCPFQEKTWVRAQNAHLSWKSGDLDFKMSIFWKKKWSFWFQHVHFLRKNASSSAISAIFCHHCHNSSQYEKRERDPHGSRLRRSLVQAQSTCGQGRSCVWSRVSREDLLSKSAPFLANVLNRPID